MSTNLQSTYGGVLISPVQVIHIHHLRISPRSLRVARRAFYIPRRLLRYAGKCAQHKFAFQLLWKSESSSVSEKVIRTTWNLMQMSHKTQSKGVVGIHQMALEMHNTFPKGCFTNVTRRLSHTPALVNQRSASPAFTLPRNERPSVLATAIKEPEIESVEDIENNVDNQSTESLYARFDALLDQTMQEYKLGDRVTGTVAR